MEPTTEDDWLIVAGDVAEDFSQVEKSLLYCPLDSQR